MCGLVGVVGDINLSAEKAFKTMLILDVLRGEDSTGVAGVGKYQGAEVMVSKTLGNPFNLFETKGFERLINRASRALIGHNRFATSGAVNRSNAHPFEFDGLVGCHNGTLTNKHDLLDSEKFKVDSENLYHYIDQRGVTEAIKNTSGAWALTWWNKDDNTMNFLRNKERPLWLCFSKEGTQLFWASEPWMLLAALGRNDVKYEEPFSLAEDMHMSIQVDNGGKMHKPVVKVVKSEVPERFFIQRGAAKDTGTKAQPTQNSRNVLTIPQKGTATALSVPSAVYLSAKAVKFEAFSLDTDSYGAQYVSCFDVNNPSFNIRLYIHAQHGIEQKLGCMFRGDISGYSTHDNGYYKISPWSVSDIEDIDDQLHKDHRGNMVSAVDWESQYGQCAFCDCNVEATDSKYVILTTSGQCLCKGCSTDTEITSMVATRH